MIALFYIGLVSLSCVATVSAMHSLDQEAIHILKSPRPFIAPVHIQREWGLSHSAPTPSFVPKSPKTPKSQNSAEAPELHKSPKNKSPEKPKEKWLGESKRSASEGAVPDLSATALSMQCPSCSTSLIAAFTLKQQVATKKA